MSEQELLTSTIGGLVVWVMTFGISAAVSYFLGWFDSIPESFKSPLRVVLNVLLTVVVMTLANSIPVDVQSKTVLEAGVLGLTYLISHAGSYFGSFKSTTQRLELLAVLNASHLSAEQVQVRWAGPTLGAHVGTAK